MADEAGCQRIWNTEYIVTSKEYTEHIVPSAEYTEYIVTSTEYTEHIVPFAEYTEHTAFQILEYQDLFNTYYNELNQQGCRWVGVHLKLSSSSSSYI